MKNAVKCDFARYRSYPYSRERAPQNLGVISFIFHSSPYSPVGRSPFRQASRTKTNRKASLPRLLWQNKKVTSTWYKCAQNKTFLSRRVKAVPNENPETEKMRTWDSRASYKLLDVASNATHRPEDRAERGVRIVVGNSFEVLIPCVLLVT